MRPDIPERTPLRFWRSLLFVPGHRDRMIAGAPGRGADALIYDLEDAVPAAEKSAARARVCDVLRDAARSEARLVRINADLPAAVRDLEAVVPFVPDAILVPKAESADYLKRVDAAVRQLNGERGTAAGGIPLVALIESADGLAQADGIAAAACVQALAFGPEDFCAETGMLPCMETLHGPAQAIALAARRHNRAAFGSPASLAEFEDLGAFAAAATAARRLGFSGAFAVHPRQVQPLNERFLPAPEELARARAIVGAAEGHSGGAVKAGSLMVDEPLVKQARECLARAAHHDGG